MLVHSITSFLLCCYGVLWDWGFLIEVRGGNGFAVATSWVIYVNIWGFRFEIDYILCYIRLHWLKKHVNLNLVLVLLMEPFRPSSNLVLLKSTLQYLKEWEASFMIVENRFFGKAGRPSWRISFFQNLFSNYTALIFYPKPQSIGL